jgi:hypothetical protein
MIAALARLLPDWETSRSYVCLGVRDEGFGHEFERDWRINLMKT